MGYRWIKQAQEYRCAGGSHHASFERGIGSVDIQFLSYLLILGQRDRHDGNSSTKAREDVSSCVEYWLIGALV